MGRREEAAWRKGTVALTAARERGDIGLQFQNRLTMTRSSIDRLGLEKELHGHTGCVNCLEWNRDGSILASASDDLHVILWDPYQYRQLHKIVTGHTGNIFSVKFLSPDNIVTCAADGTVRARSIEGGAALLECSCHCGRVKRLAAAPDHTQIVWSAAEDGFILQHDLRTPHSCNTDSANVVVNLLNHLGRFSEAKCVAVNPRRPYQLAVGANDYYVRMYDVRMIKLAKLQSLAPSSRQSWDRQNVRSSRAGHGDPDNNIPKDAVQYFAPGHLQWAQCDMFPKKATTYVAYNNDGNELLVNMGSEQIYIFDIDSAPAPVLVDSFIIQQNHAAEPRDPGDSHDPHDPRDERPPFEPRGSYEHHLPPHIDMLKEMGNRLVSKSKFTSAIDVYNHALSKCESAVLYSNKAAALMRRGWVGDTYAAIKDCYRAIKLDPGHVKSHFRLARALMDMKRPREAQECLLYFKNKFPKHSSSHAVFLLQKDINVALESAGMPDEPDDTESEELQKTSALERQLRAGALDYKQRFLGHCNTTTDIKEANFLGPDAKFIAAGSDDGSMFIWCRATGNIVRCLRGDESIVNCIQPQPASCMLATSGIETVVRLWSPRPEDGLEEPRLVADGAAAAAANQQRMRSDPFEAMLINIAGNHHHEPPCRPT